MDMRLRYLPIHEVEEGMTLAAPVVLTEHGVSNFSLPAGHVLTETNLRQMVLRHAEFVCVALPDERSDEAREADKKASEARLRQIFRSADLHDSLMSRLFEALLAYRSL